MFSKTRKIKLGDKVRCKFTGFEGTVMGRTEYITGCVTVGILPFDLDEKTGVPKDWQWLDEVLLEVISETKSERISTVGGPHLPNPPQG